MDSISESCATCASLSPATSNGRTGLADLQRGSMEGCQMCSLFLESISICIPDPQLRNSGYLMSSLYGFFFVGDEDAEEPTMIPLDIFQLPGTRHLYGNVQLG